MLTAVNAAKAGLCLVTTLDVSRLCLALPLVGREEVTKPLTSSLLSRSLYLTHETTRGGSEDMDRGTVNC